MKKKHIKIINIVMTVTLMAILWQTISIYLNSKKTNNSTVSTKTHTADTQKSAVENKKTARKSIFGSLIGSNKQNTPTFILKGTITANTKLSAAIIEMTTNKTQQIYHKGDKLPDGSTISEIKRQYITLNNGKHIWINKHKSKFQDSSSIKKVSSRSWEVKKEVIDKNLGDINSLLKEIRIIPHFTANEPDGFLLRDIKANSFFSEIGIKNEDIIKAINNTEIKSPLEAVKALQVFMFNETENIKIKIERNKQEIDLHYKIN